MDEMELRHKRNYLLTNELPIAIDQLKEQFFEAFMSEDDTDLAVFIFSKVQQLVCMRYGIPCNEFKEVVQIANISYENACGGSVFLATYEIKKEFIVKKCDSKFLTVAIFGKDASVRVFCAEYDVMDLFGEKQETYFVCEPTKEGRHNNFGSIDNGDYETYIKRVKEVLEN